MTLLWTQIINVQRNGYLQKGTYEHAPKACLACYSATIPTRLAEKQRFLRMVIGCSSVNLFLILPARQKALTKGAILGILNKKRLFHTALNRGAHSDFPWGWVSACFGPTNFLDRLNVYKPFALMTKFEMRIN